MGDGRYLILDEAHRTEALRRLGCRRLVVQGVDAAVVTLDGWDHIVPEGAWLAALRRRGDLRWADGTRGEGGEETPVATLTFSDGRVWCVYAAADGPDARLAAWHAVVDAYSRVERVRRVPRAEEVALEPGFVRWRFPLLRFEEITALAARGRVMPRG